MSFDPEFYAELCETDLAAAESYRATWLEALRTRGKGRPFDVARGRRATVLDAGQKELVVVPERVEVVG